MTYQLMGKRKQKHLPSSPPDLFCLFRYPMLQGSPTPMNIPAVTALLPWGPLHGICREVVPGMQLKRWTSLSHLHQSHTPNPQASGNWQKLSDDEAC